MRRGSTASTGGSVQQQAQGTFPVGFDRHCCLTLLLRQQILQLKISKQKKKDLIEFINTADDL